MDAHGKEHGRQLMAWLLKQFAQKSTFNMPISSLQTSFHEKGTVEYSQGVVHPEETAGRICILFSFKKSAMFLLYNLLKFLDPIQENLGESREKTNFIPVSCRKALEAQLGCSSHFIILFCFSTTK